MKKFLIAVLISTAIASVGSFKAEAQSCTPGGTYYKKTTLPIYAGKLDTVNGSSGVDTFKTQISCNPHSVTFTEVINKIAGRIDSFTVTYWGSLDGVNFTQLSTTTSANASNTIYYVLNSGQGNPFSWYMVTSKCANVAAGSSASWQGQIMVRN